MDRRQAFYISLIAIFLIAFAARGYLIRYTYIFGFDSYWFARMVSYIIRYGHLPEKDPLVWWGFRDQLKPLRWELSMYIPAWIYIAVFGPHYDRMKLLTVFKWLPAIFGALGSVFNALLAYVVAGPLAGFLSGYFAATNPAYIYRTMSGFYEDDASSFWIPLTMFLLFKALEEKDRRRYIYLLLAGVSSLLGALSWTGYLIVGYTLLPLIAFSVALLVIGYLRSRIRVKHPIAYALALSAALAIAVDLLVEQWAYGAAGRAFEFLGSVPQTIIYIIAVPTAATVLMAVFSTLLVFAYRRRSASLAAYALAAFLLTLPIYHYVATKGFEASTVTPSGLEIPITLRNVPGGALNLLFGGALVSLLAILAGAFSALLFAEGEPADRKSLGWTLAGYVAIIIFALFAIPLNGFNILGPVVSFVTNYNAEQVLAPQASSVISATVGEETFGFLNWPAKYGVLAILVFLTVPLLVVRAEKDPRYAVLLAWLAVGWYSAWSKLKFTYYLGLPISFAVGIFLADVWERVPKNVWNGKLRWGYISLIALLLFSMLGTGIYHTVSRIPSLLSPQDVQNTPFLAPGQDSRDYIEAFRFIEENVPRDARILNWWNLGHWLTFFTEHNVMTDNTNAVWKADQLAALFFISPEENAYRIAKEYNYDYVFFESSYPFSLTSFAVYAFWTPNPSDPRIQRYAAYRIPCAKASLGDQNVYFCAGFAGRWLISPYLWYSIATLTPTDPVLQNAAPATLRVDGVELNLYRYANRLSVPENAFLAVPPLSPTSWRESNAAYAKIFIAGREFVVYRDGDALLLLAPGANDSVSMKMYLGITRLFTPVFVSSRRRVMIYKVRGG